jgi:hypothetical protein
LLNPEHWFYDDVARRACNPYNDAVNFVTNMKAWESICDDAGVPWLFMTESFGEHLEPVQSLWRDARRNVAPGMHTLIRQCRDDPSTGLARDMLHGGIEPHRRIADAFFESFVDVYPKAVERFKADESLARVEPSATTALVGSDDA